MDARRCRWCTSLVLALACWAIWAAGTESGCVGDGDRECPKEERDKVDPGPDGRSLLDKSPGRLGTSPRDGGRDAKPSEDSLIHIPDGRICWPHGDHFHCR
jgi:hypothetical protein